MFNQFERVCNLTERVDLTCLGKTFSIIVARDQIYSNQFGGRVYIQLAYTSRCVKTGQDDAWRGRKWYLSEFMTDDEIVKTCYAAFKACVEHEILEGFKVDGKILFNPHVNFESLLKVSGEEVTREEKF